MIPNGYNLTSGGEIKKEISEETRKRLRESHLGYKNSEETKKKMSETRKGHITTQETRDKISRHTTKI